MSAILQAAMTSVMGKFLTFPSVGQALYESSSPSSTQTFVVPAGVFKICVVAVGRGGAGTSSASGRGGALAYRNDIPVTPGETLTVAFLEASTRLLRSTTELVLAPSGSAGLTTPEISGQVTWFGGNAGAGYYGGSGAGGYSGMGGYGADTGNRTGGNGSGGGGGGGGVRYYIGAYTGAAGGGVGLMGQGVNGQGGLVSTTSTAAGVGTGGSGGEDGNPTSFAGGKYGGGSNRGTSGTGGWGGLRIIWGPGRMFPSTNTEDMVLEPVIGEIIATATRDFVVPANVTMIHGVAVGFGATPSVGGSYGLSGGGGGLSYRNEIPVTPGETLTLTVDPTNNGTVSVKRGATFLLAANNANNNAGGAAYSLTGQFSQKGGNAGANGSLAFGGGGGAGGYDSQGGNGGSGRSSSEGPGTNGTASGDGGGGGGGGGAKLSSPANYGGGGRGGGVGLFGAGPGGAGGIAGTAASVPGTSGGDGSSWKGDVFGAGGNGAGSLVRLGGAIRLMWGGGRRFPYNADAVVTPGEIVVVGGEYGESVVSQNFLVPENVYSICAVAVGPGGHGSGGGGGGLSYRNDIPVTPGELLSIVVSPIATTTGLVQLVRFTTPLVAAYGAAGKTGGAAYSLAGQTSYAGGTAAASTQSGAGGAAGYMGAGGAGGTSYTSNTIGGAGGTPAAGSGAGGGGSGAGNSIRGGVGGGVGLFGLGDDGVGGVTAVANASVDGTAGSVNKSAQTFGRGGHSSVTGKKSEPGAIRIIWGYGRSFPNNASPAPPAIPSQQLFKTSQTFVVPEGVFFLCGAACGFGGVAPTSSGNYGSGAGGRLAWCNDIPVWPGETLSVIVETTGVGVQRVAGTWLLHATSANGNNAAAGTAAVAGQISWPGGIGRAASSNPPGSGGAGGYTGLGGSGGTAAGFAASANSGGGGGGGAMFTADYSGGRGGGVGLNGIGHTGAGGLAGNPATGDGEDGSPEGGEVFGWGGTRDAPPGPGAVRLMWGGNRNYPSSAGNIFRFPR